MKREKSSKEEGEASYVSEEDSDDEFDNLKKIRAQRYWAEENPTIKCHNCWQFGHVKKDCPNDTKRNNCILCGEDTHESFDCHKKMCFKCNKVGHQARDCTEKNIESCSKCKSIGHNAERCLKVWKEPSGKILKKFRCI